MKKILLVILLLFIFLGVGYYFFVKKQQKEIKNGQVSSLKIVKQDDPPFMLNFPNGLIPEKGIINVVDSFRVEKEGSAQEQFTYKYVTNDPFSSIHPYFDQYFIKNGFSQGMINSNENTFYLNAQKDKVSVSVYAEKNKVGSGTLVEINVVK